jgi:hypothetical protein
MLKLASSAAVAAIFLAQAAQAQPLVRFDVAEDHTRFVFAPTPVHDDGLPAYGNPFVTQGYIYEAGTLDGGVEGVNPDGSPVFGTSRTARTPPPARSSSAANSSSSTAATRSSPMAPSLPTTTSPCHASSPAGSETLRMSRA